MSFHYLPRLVLPALERLEVYNTICWEHEDDTPDHDPIQVDAPNLIYLRLSSISPRHFDVPMANIRTLTLQRLLDFVSIRLLSTTPNVERVGLYELSVDDLGPDPKNLPEIDLPQLRVLDWLHTYNNQDLYPTDVLNKISAPRVEHFRMSCDNIWEGCTFPSVHKWLNTTSSLKSFFLRTSANPEDLLQDLLLDTWTLSSQALVVLYDGPDHPDSDPTPYPWYPEDFGDSLGMHVLQNAEWKRLFQVDYVLPPVPLVPSQT